MNVRKRIAVLSKGSASAIDEASKYNVKEMFYDMEEGCLTFVFRPSWDDDPQNNQVFTLEMKAAYMSRDSLDPVLLKEVLQDVIFRQLERLYIAHHPHVITDQAKETV